MASIRREIVTKASAEEAWSALRDVGALHTRLVPGFVVDTKLEPGARVVTFGNGMVVREPIVAIDDGQMRVVWTAESLAGRQAASGRTGCSDTRSSAVTGESKQLTHYNGSAQVVRGGGGETRVVWIADLLPDEAAALIGQMMDQGMAVMKATLDRLGEGV